MQNNTFRFVWAKLYWNSVAGTVHYCSKEILRVCRQQPFNDIFPSTLLATVSPPYIYILYVMVTFYHHKLISNAKFHLKKLLISFSRPLAHSISFFWSSKNFTPSLLVYIHQNIAFFLQKMKMLVVHQMALSFMLIKYDDKTLNSFRYISFYFLFHFVFFFFLSFFLFVHSLPRALTHRIFWPVYNQQHKCGFRANDQTKIK